MTAIGKVESIGSFFVGQGDLVIFDKPADMSTAKLSTLDGAKSIGNVHMDSTNFTGEAPSIEALKNEQGRTYHSTTVEGNVGFEFFVPSTSQDMLDKLLDAGVISDTFSASTPWVTGSTVVGMSGSHALEAPIMIINDVKDKSVIFPNAKITTTIGYTDKVVGINVAVMAQDIDTANLKTVMFIQGKVQYTA